MHIMKILNKILCVKIKLQNYRMKPFTLVNSSIEFKLKNLNLFRLYFKEMGLFTGTTNYENKMYFLFKCTIFCTMK